MGDLMAVTCTRCNGTGDWEQVDILGDRIPPDLRMECEACGGDGYVIVNTPESLARDVHQSGGTD